MLRNSNIILLSRHFKSCRVKLRRNYRAKVFNPTRLDNYLNTSKFKEFTPLKFLGITSNLRFQHELKSELEEDLDKFSKILTKLDENQKNLSVSFITSIIDEMHELLKDIALEEYHEQKLLRSKSFGKLTRAVVKLVNEIDVNDLVRYLDLCNKLHIVHVIHNPITILWTVKENAGDLTLENKVKCLLLLNDKVMALDKQFVHRLRGDFAMRVENAIKIKEYLNCPEDMIAALQCLTMLKKIPINYKIHVLYAILDLKKWDDGIIFKLFLKTELPEDHTLTVDVKERFKERILREIDNNNRFLSDFLVSFAKNMKNLFGYDKDLIDAVVNKILENNLNTQQIRKVCTSLEHLDHVNYKLIEYLAEFLKKNPSIFTSHPIVTAQIIDVIAKSNCNYKERNRWSNIQQIINNSNLPEVVKNLKHEELKCITEDIDRMKNARNNYFNSWKHLVLLANLNSAVKVLYPSYERLLLNEDDLSIVIDKFRSVYKASKNSLIRLESLMEIGKHLESTSGVNNCLLLNGMTKFGFVFDGLIAVNKEGRLYDFKIPFKEDEKIFLEDMDLPNDYSLIALLLASEGEHSRNTWDLKPPCALRVKITEKLGYRTHIIYESWWKTLKSDEKEKYLCMLQGYG